MNAPSEPRLVSVNGVDLAFEEFGGGNVPLVLVHGFTGSRDDFSNQVAALGERFRVVSLDLRGHGDSTNTGKGASYTIEQLGDDLLGFLDALGIETCHLLGHSMGGMVALHLVLAHPERVASLILMDTAAGPIEPFPREIVNAAIDRARRDGMEGVFEMATKAAAVDPNRPAANRAWEKREGSGVYWDRVRRKYLAMDPEAFAALWVVLLDRVGVIARLDEIECPTLVMVGDQDRAFLKAADALEKGISGCRRVTIPDAAHSPQFENAAAWFNAILSHMNRVLEATRKETRS